MRSTCIYLLCSLLAVSTLIVPQGYASTPLTTVAIKKALSSIVDIEASKDIGHTTDARTFTNTIMRKRITLIKTKTDQFIKNGVGIILDNHGTIVTNAHTVKDSQRITVRLSNGKSMKARLTAFMPEKDLAFLSIPASTTLTPITFSNSDKLIIGQNIFTVGQSRFLKGTIVHGKILGLLQSKQHSGPTVSMLQTNFDVRAYQGDSGSPIFDDEGHLVGLLFAAAKEAKKICFAIPANTIRSVYKRLHIR